MTGEEYATEVTRLQAQLVDYAQKLTEMTARMEAAETERNKLYEARREELIKKDDEYRERSCSSNERIAADMENIFAVLDKRQ